MAKSYIEIKRWDNGEVVVCGEYESIKDCLQKNPRADLTWANLAGADLTEANLAGADLTRANLIRANLARADLTWADLTEANLTEANLAGANLAGANLIRANLARADLIRADLTEANLTEASLAWALYLPNLYILKLLPKITALRAWKYLKNGESPYFPKRYEVGKIYKFSDCDKNEQTQCGKGGNVATLPWCLSNNLDADEFIEVKFKAGDICAIPYTTDGKFRVKRFKVLRKVNRKQALALLKKAMEQ